MNIIQKIFGTHSQNELKRVYPIADAVMALDEDMQKLSDEELKALPGAIFGMLVVYCLRNVDVLHFAYGLPELIAIAVTISLHLWKRQMLLSIAGGTVCYMLLVQFVF